MKSFIFLVLYCVCGLNLSITGNNHQVTETMIFFSTQNEPELKAADFAGRLDELLTLKIVAEISDFDASKAEKEYENKFQAAFGGTNKPPRECNYLWDNGRTRTLTMGGHTVNAPYKDKVAIHSVSNTTIERFKRMYGALTTEQKQAAAKKLEEEADKKSNSATSQNLTHMGTGMIQNLQAESISGVGEAATWYENSNKLIVFYKGLIFSVEVDISDDKMVNRKKSIELSKKIIEQKLN